jgi:F420-non-reducing hydrogenase iron-sulfur subunit
MFNMTQELVKIIGIESERIRLQWLSASEGTRFVQAVREFTEQIKALGPSSLKRAA